jgi:hypothetical protein
LQLSFEFFDSVSLAPLCGFVLKKVRIQGQRGWIQGQRGWVQAQRGAESGFAVSFNCGERSDTFVQIHNR